MCKEKLLLFAKDNPEDRYTIERMFKESGLPARIHFVQDGEDLMDYLHQRGKYSSEDAPPPDLIVLDLNMPEKNGYKALGELKDCENLRNIPVAVLTSSTSWRDIEKSHDLGAIRYWTKPMNKDKYPAIFQDILSKA